MDYVPEKFGDQRAFRIINPNICAYFLHQINQMYGVHPITINKFPGAQPCSIMRQDMCILQSEPYMVAEKTDGTRYLMFLTRTKNRESFIVMIDRSLTMRVIKLEFDQRVFDANTLFDGELVLNQDTGKWIYLIFDLIGSGAAMRPTDNFARRLQNSFYIIGSLMQARPESDPFTVQVKQFFPTQEIQALASAVEMHQGRRSDGLVFVPINRPVKPYRNSIMYKWKQQTHHTIDCLLKYVKLVAATAGENANQQHKHVKINRAEEEPEQTSSNTTTLIIGKACKRRCVAIPTSLMQKSSVILKMQIATLKKKALCKKVAAPAKTPIAVPPSERCEFNGDSISPNSIDMTAFELFLIDTRNQLVFFDKCDVELNREFLQHHAMQIVAAGHEIVVECCFAGKHTETNRLRWKIMLERKDRSRPNTEYTVQRTIENINEDISLLEIIECFRKNTDGVWFKAQPVRHSNLRPAPQRNRPVPHYRNSKNDAVNWQDSQSIARRSSDVSWQSAMNTNSVAALSQQKRQRRENSDHRPQWLIDQIESEKKSDQKAAGSNVANHTTNNNNNNNTSNAAENIQFEYDPMMPAYDYGDDETSLSCDAKQNSISEQKNLLTKESSVISVDSKLLNMLQDLQHSLRKNPTPGILQ